MLEDGYGRQVEYLRLSVTDRCDLRCSYCRPERFCGYEEPSQWLDFDEIERLVAVFTRLGVKRVRLTGGEPLLRRNLPDLACRLSLLRGIEDLSLSTNGTRLIRFAQELKAAGVTRLNVSLDSLDAARIRSLTGREVLPQILAGLEEAAKCGFTLIKINMVALPGIGDDDVDAMVAYCAAHGFVLRLIEAMPMGSAGRTAGYVDLRPLQDRLRNRFGLIDGMVPGGGPARYLVSPDGRFQVGFITPISRHFCASCNRVRLAVDGTLHLCLGQDDQVGLGELLRAGGSDDDIAAAIASGLRRKPARHEFQDRPDRIIRPMSATGG